MMSKHHTKDPLFIKLVASLTKYIHGVQKKYWHCAVNTGKNTQCTQETNSDMAQSTNLLDTYTDLSKSSSMYTFFIFY